MEVRGLKRNVLPKGLCCAECCELGDLLRCKRERGATWAQAIKHREYNGARGLGLGPSGTECQTKGFWLLWEAGDKAQYSGDLLLFPGDPAQGPQEK